jgi:hypothetical protein
VSSFSVLNWRQDLPRRGRLIKARCDDHVPIVIGRNTSNASVRRMLSHLLPFTGLIADVDKKIVRLTSLLPVSRAIQNIIGLFSIATVR